MIRSGWSSDQIRRHFLSNSTIYCLLNITPLNVYLLPLFQFSIDWVEGQTVWEANTPEASPTTKPSVQVKADRLNIAIKKSNAEQQETVTVNRQQLKKNLNEFAYDFRARMRHRRRSHRRIKVRRASKKLKKTWQSRNMQIRLDPNEWNVKVGEWMD